MYCGRLAPSPTGLLHVGHARTFAMAAQRANEAGGSLLLRNDDLDAHRCRPEYVSAFVEDLRWLGLKWTAPMITQSERIGRYREILALLYRQNLIFPCFRSRRDVNEAASAPHEGQDGDLSDEPIYPTAFRPAVGTAPLPLDEHWTTNWRFRVPNNDVVTFTDGNLGRQQATVGSDFGDFLVWRKDGLPSYQLASVTDDVDFGVTEVVRGADLIKSTFRQCLLFQALGHPSPQFFHCPLVRDGEGKRLAKRHDSLSVRALRESGLSPDDVLSCNPDGMPPPARTGTSLRLS